MKSIWLTVLGAAVVVITGALIRWLPRCWNYLQRRIRPDHSALYQGEWPLQSGSSGDARVKVKAACAPSRSLHLRNVDPDASINFVRIHFPDLFETKPAYSISSSGIRFESPKSGLDSGFLWVWPSGRIDLVLPVEVNIQLGHQITCDLLDILKPISRLANAIDSKEYQLIFPAKKKFLGRRFDWFISVSPTVTTSDGIANSWTDLNFPGDRPPRAGSQQQANCPRNGFAHDELKNWNPRKGRESLLRIFLLDFLLQNGFHNCEKAISQTLISARNPKRN